MNTNDKPPTEHVNAIFLRLGALKASFGLKPNKDDRTAALIGACIVEGLDTRKQIVGALRQLEINQAHVVLQLDRHSGGDPTYHLWQLGEDRRYRLLNHRTGTDAPA